MFVHRSLLATGFFVALTLHANASANPLTNASATPSPASLCNIENGAQCGRGGCCMPDEITGAEYTCYEQDQKWAQCLPTGSCPPGWTCNILTGEQQTETITEEPTVTEAICGNLLEYARGCDLWVREDLQVGTGYVDGKVCVGGDLTIGQGYSVGLSLAMLPECDDDYSVVVAGDVSWEFGGMQIRSHCVGGTVTDPSRSGDIDTPVSYNMCPGDRKEDENKCKDVIDFASDHEKLMLLSDMLWAGPTGFKRSSAVKADGLILIRLDASAPLHVVSVDAHLFNAVDVYGLQIVADGGSLDDIELVVLNLEQVPDEGLQIGKKFEFESAFGSRVLFNHRGHQTLAFNSGWEFHASLLAPRASLAGTSTGNIFGQLVVKSYMNPASSAASTLVNQRRLDRVSVCVEASIGHLAFAADGKDASQVNSSAQDDAGGVSNAVLLAVGIILAVLIAALLVALLLRRRRSDGELRGIATAEEANFMRAHGLAPAAVDASKFAIVEGVDAEVLYAAPTKQPLDGEKSLDPADASPMQRPALEMLRKPPSSRSLTSSFSRAASAGLRRLSTWSKRSAGLTDSPREAVPPLARDLSGVCVQGE